MCKAFEAVAWNPRAGGLAGEAVEAWFGALQTIVGALVVCHRWAAVVDRRSLACGCGLC